MTWQEIAVRAAIRRSETPLATLLQQLDDDRDGLLSLPEFARAVEQCVTGDDEPGPPPAPPVRR